MNHFNLTFQRNAPAADLQVLPHHFPKHLYGIGYFSFSLQMRSHPDRFKGIKQKVRVDLACQHFQFDFSLLLLQQAFLLVRFLNLRHQRVDTAHHRIELTGKLGNLVLTFNLHCYR
ncbi:hypothetical protein D3C78_1361170 [compost metagenome]